MHTPLAPSLAERDRQPELMDQPDLDEAEHAQALAGLGRINWFSRSTAIVWPAIERLARQVAPEPLRVLDVACGGGDVAIALVRRARRKGIALQVAGCDISETALRFAADRAAREGTEVEFFPADVLGEGLPPEYGVVMCSLFMHHLEEDDARTMLMRMAEAAQRMVLVNDLVRSRFGYLLAYFGTRLLSRSRIVHYDGPLSVRSAFTVAEAQQLAEQAGLTGAQFTRHWPQRFLLAWNKPTNGG